MAAAGNKSEQLTSIVAGSTTPTPATSTFPLPSSMAILSSTTLAIMGGLGLAVYLPMLIAVARNRDGKFASAYYKLFLALGAAEILYLLEGCVESFCMVRAYTLNSATCEIPVVLDSTLAWLSYLAFYCEFLFDLLIAFNRLFAVVFYAVHDVVFSRARVTIMCVVGWLFAFAVSTPLMVEYFPTGFVVDEMAYDLTAFSLGAWYWHYTTYIIAMSCVAFSFLFYAITIVGLFVHRRRMKHLVTTVGGKGGGVNAQKPEVKLLIQSFLRFALLVAVIIFNLEQQGSSLGALYAQAVVGFLVPLNTVLVTLCLNTDVRVETYRLFCRHSTVKNTVRRQLASSQTPGTGKTGTGNAFISEAAV